MITRNFIFIALLFCLTACQQGTNTANDENSPEFVARNFATLMGEGDNDAAMQYGTKNTERFLAFRTEMITMLGENLIQPVKIEELECIVVKDKATCNFCCDQNGEKTSIPLIKVEKKWLVDIQIDDLIEEFEAAQKEE